MTNMFRSRNLYKLIISIFLIVSIVKIRNQLVTLKIYDDEINVLNEKIATLKSQEDSMEASNHSKKDNEDIARKELKMYYPNETPYKGY